MDLDKSTTGTIASTPAATPRWGRQNGKSRGGSKVMSLRQPGGQAVGSPVEKPVPHNPACRSIYRGLPHSRSTARRWSGAPRRWERGVASKSSGKRPGSSRALSLIDLTTLSGDDTPERVRRLLCQGTAAAAYGFTGSAGLSEQRLQVGAVCVYHAYVGEAVEALQGSGIPVAAVSTGFPAGLSPFETRVREIEASVAAGASEIDVVITRAHALRGDWQALYDEVRAFKAACGSAHLKGHFGNWRLEDTPSGGARIWVAMMAGADFIKTSTGKENPSMRPYR